MSKRGAPAALFLAACLTAGTLLSPAALAAGEDALPAAALVNPEIPCQSAILIEQTSGRVLFEKDPDTPMPPASITKIMTLLLVMEALDAGTITLETAVTCSPHAASMGGAQIWLEPGEQMTVHELLKATAISSANDAAVALGELISGSEEAFVARMNERAGELGMKNTTFQNATGLDAQGHLTTVRDIAVMSQALLSHPLITEYSTVWMDSLRNGETQLVNTNKLVRFFEGATGLKTGTTDGAGYCLSASATRKGLSLIAVVLGADTSDHRFGSARGLLEYGFAHYEAREVPPPDPALEPLPVRRGVRRTVELACDAPKRMLLEKGRGEQLTEQRELAGELEAPVDAGTRVGTIRLLLDGVVVCEYPVKTASAVERMTMKSAFPMFWGELIRMGPAGDGNG